MIREIKGTKENEIIAFVTQEIPIYKERFGVLFVNKVVELPKQLINKTGQDTVDFAHFFYLGEKIKHKEIGLFLIAFNLGKNANLTRGVIAHEICHAVNHILLDRGVYLTEDSDEAFAYLNEWLTERTYEVIDKYKIKL